MPLDDRQILVVGGTGLLGQPVVYMLDHFGFPVRILTRSIEKGKSIFGKHFDLVEGSLENPESLKAAMDGCYGVHINLKGNYIDNSFDRIEYQGTKRILGAAKSANVKRITFISGSSVSKERIYYPGIKAKYQAEQEIINSGLDYAIFRATWFMESLQFYIRNKQATVMGKDRQKIHWIAAEDYAKMVTRAYILDDPPNDIFTVFGPEAYTFREALGIYTRYIDPGLKVKQVPLGILKFFATITFSKQLRNILPFMQYFDETGELGDPAKTDELLGSPRITLENWAKELAQKQD